MNVQQSLPKHGVLAALGVVSCSGGAPGVRMLLVNVNVAALHNHFTIGTLTYDLNK